MGILVSQCLCCVKHNLILVICALFKHMSKNSFNMKHLMGKFQ